MQPDNSMVERILHTLENIINNDEYLKDFTIIPTVENITNKSPVLYEEHNIGLESWCIKHIYNYAYVNLFKVRKSLADGRLSSCKMENLNYLLTGVLLINPDVSTFWNMRRELVENNILKVEKELLFTKLVLSHKSKSNETFIYRRWLLNRQLSKVNDDDLLTPLVLLNEEMSVTEMAAEKAANNYHAWTHRTWAVNNFTQVNRSLFEFGQLEFSLKWIFLHVSEHTGFHYRQFIHKRIKENKVSIVINEDLYHHLKNLTGISSTISYKELLNELLGKQDFCSKDRNDINLINYLAALLFDLYFMLDKLNVTFPCHETFWYHRRYVIYHIMQFAYEYHGVSFKTNAHLENSLMLRHNCNITKEYDFKNDEIQAKLLKYEPNKIESSYLYRLIVKNERKVLCDYLTSGVNADCVKCYEKWLKYIMGFHGF